MARREKNEPVSYPCPHCNINALEATASTPYVRGYVIFFEYGSKNHIGCTSCVRKNVMKEIGLSFLIGWFSPKSLLINPLLIVFNTMKLPFIKVNHQKVRTTLRKANIPLNREDEVDVTSLGYCLAARMIMADGKVEEEEIEAAARIGKNIFANFNMRNFTKTMEQAKDLPSAQNVANILKDTLNDEGKQLICSYLLAIAASDGHIDQKEEELLVTIAHNMNFDLELLKKEFA